MKDTIAQRIIREIKEKQDELTAHQNKCRHPRATKEHCSNTGGYDGPMYDTYWTIFTCPTCTKRWREEGSK